MLSINTIARVVVNTVRTAASPASFDTGLLLVQENPFFDTHRLNAFSSAAEAAAGLTEMGFLPSSEAYKAVIKYFAASPTPSRLLFSCYPATENVSQALDAVLDRMAEFYGVMTCDSVAAGDYLTFARHVESLSQPLMLFVPVTGTVSSVIASNAVLDKLHGASIKRAVPFYCTTLSDAAALMGTAMGLALSHTTSAFALCYKTVYGVEPSALTEVQAENIKALNGNVFLTRGYTHMLLEKGTVSSGARYDEILYLDMIADELQNAAVTLLAENPDRLPQTDDSTAQFINRFTSILMSYTERGVLASGLWRGVDTGPLSPGDSVENGFALWADSYDDQPDADRMAHKAVPIQVGLVLAGSIESIVITVNVMI